MGSFSHVLSGFSLGFRYRQTLLRLLESTSPSASIHSLDPAALSISGISVLALDFDGVLAPHGAAEPLPEAILWMKKCEAVFGAEQFFILSNKPTEVRRQWFADNFPAARFISGVRKKPYPDGLIKTGELAKVPLSRILMVDDRLLTGCLAAILAGARPCYIRSPYVSFKHLPHAELFFGLLRVAERVFIRFASYI